MTDIGEEAYRLIGEPRLQESSKTLCGPAQQTLKVKGQFMGWLRRGLKSTRWRIYVAGGLKTNLLGLPAIQDLQLMRRIEATEIAQPEVVTQFPRVFQGLGTIGEEYCIKLQDDARPYSLYVSRDVPIPLRPKVKDELNTWNAWGLSLRSTLPRISVQAW